MPGGSRTGPRRAVLAAVTAAAALAACGRARDVVVYVPTDDPALSWAESSFETAAPDVDVHLVPVPSAELVERLSAQRDAPDADLVWGAPSWVLAAAAREGLLAETSPPWTARVPDAWRDPAGRWVGSLVDPVVFAVNHDSVSLSRAPRDWIDLFHPQWADQVLVPEPGVTDVGTLLLGERALASSRQYGDIVDAMDWFRRLDGVRAAYVDDASILVRDLARGRASVALTLLSVAQGASEDGAPVAYTVPQSGGPVLVQGVALVAGGTDPEDAARFVAWLGSPEVAADLETKLRRRPSWVKPDGDMPPWMARAWNGFVPRDVPADSLAVHLDAWAAAWRTQARGRGLRVLVP